MSGLVVGVSFPGASSAVRCERRLGGLLRRAPEVPVPLRLSTASPPVALGGE